MSYIKCTEGVQAVFIDKLIDTLKLKNDAALSRAMKVEPAVICKLRHGNLPFSGAMIIKVHKITGWPVLQIEKELGIENEFA